MISWDGHHLLTPVPVMRQYHCGLEVSLRDMSKGSCCPVISLVFSFMKSPQLLQFRQVPYLGPPRPLSQIKTNQAAVQKGSCNRLWPGFTGQNLGGRKLPSAASCISHEKAWVWPKIDVYWESSSIMLYYPLSFCMILYHPLSIFLLVAHHGKNENFGFPCSNMFKQHCC